MTRGLVASGIALLLITADASAAGRTKIRALNIGGQALLTLVTGIVQGNVHGTRDVVRCLTAGSASGFGFYEAKRLTGDRHVQTGWIVANAAASLSENTAAGKNPFAQIGYSIGPVRFRIPIAPLDPTADSRAYVDMSVYEAAAFVRAWSDNDRAVLRKGLIVFKRNSVYPGNDERFVTIGQTYGMFPGLSPQAIAATWPHEAIHAMQSLQGDSVEPAFRFLSYEPKRQQSAPKRWIRFEHLRPGIVNLSDDTLLSRQAYEQRWTEIEAFRLSQDVRPPK